MLSSPISASDVNGVSGEAAAVAAAAATAAAAAASAPTTVSMPSPQFAALCARLEPPDGLVLGWCSHESQVVRTDAAEAATSARRRYHAVSLVPLAKLTVATAAQVARAAADARLGGAGAPASCVIGWYRRRIGGCLRPDQQPQQVQLSAKEAHIHRQLCAAFALPDLLLVLVRHVKDPVTQALVTDTAAVRLRHSGVSGVSSVECLPLVVQPLARVPLARDSDSAAAAAAAATAAEADAVTRLRRASRQRCGRLARELAAAADAGFDESLLALEALAGALTKITATGIAAAAAGDDDDDEDESLPGDSQETPASPVF